MEQITERERFRELGKQQFSNALRSPDSWFMQSEQLCRAAYVLIADCWEATKEREKLPRNVKLSAEEHDLLQRSVLFREASFLLGLSLENAFKGLWVKQNPSLVEGVNRLPKVLRTHKLCKLADCTGIPLSTGERRVLNLLTEHSVWYGRYGVPSHEGESADFWEARYKPAFLMQNYPNEFSWPIEIKSIFKKIISQCEQTGA